MNKQGLTFLAILTIPLIVSASSLELTSNGDFEEPLFQGWKKTLVGYQIDILRGTDFDHDTDYEMSIACSNGYGDAKLRQEIFLPSLETVFSAELKSFAVDGAGAWVTCGLMLNYLDEYGGLLGRTLIGSLSEASEWNPGEDFHFIDDTGDWSLYSFSIADELLNVPAVNSSEVRRLAVEIFVFSANC